MQTKLPINTKAFSNLKDPETLYWLGWLYADVCIYDNNRKFKLSL